MSGSNPYRSLPSVDQLIRSEAMTPLLESYGKAEVVESIRGLLEEARIEIGNGRVWSESFDWAKETAARLGHELADTLLPLINGTGVIIHTNLGRAPLSRKARTAVVEISRGYSSLEYSLSEGKRGSRHEHAGALIRRLTGAEDCMIVNNNASAIFLVLAALCSGSEVLVSRGELVEIGGGFRIPDVLRQSGARLVEVGTTNRTHPHDFTDAVGPETAALLRIHPSNFRQIGFVTTPTLAESVAVLRTIPDRVPPLVIDDLGSGTLLDTSQFGLAPEPMVQSSVEAGADLVTFSGDKLLGGPQAGIIVGRAPLIERLRRHPLARALRVDKMTLAALDATLRSYRRGSALTEIPVWQMISAQTEALRRRAEGWRDRLADAGIESGTAKGESTVGGGSLPGETLPTTLLTIKLSNLDEFVARLRDHSPPVICRIQNDLVLVDPRTVLVEQDDTLVDALIQTGHGL